MHLSENIKDELQSELDEFALNQSYEEGTITNDFSDISPQVGTKKPKRNDACPCGSGEKYKNCCGKSGPKKGLLA